MKVNLLRDDQMTGVPHQDKEEDKMHFDDTFSGGGNDDFYFQQPPPASEEYKRPRKSRFWLFALLLLLFLFIGALISNPQGTKRFFAGIGDRAADLWRNVFNTGRTSEQIIGSETPVHVEKEDKEAKEEAVKEDTREAAPERKIIEVEKIIEKEVVKESTEEVVLESPPVYEEIRDALAATAMNIKAAGFVWSQVPGGMTVDKLHFSGNEMTLSVSSRYPMLLDSYGEILGQYTQFDTLRAGDPEKAGELTAVLLNGRLKKIKSEDRPDRLWNLDVEWFDDYLDQAAERTGVHITQEITADTTLEEGILRYDIHLTVNGNRSSMALFFEELHGIPASFAVGEIASNYYPEDETNLLEIALNYYERK